MHHLRGTECFIYAVERGSIAAAARRLNISPAAASQNIARLEAALDMRLLNRTTRKLTLTDAGQIYYDQVQPLLYQLSQAEHSLDKLREEPQGRLCVASSAAFARHVLAPLIPEFTRQYPQISIELVSTDRTLDHFDEQVDVSIRIREQLQEGLVARRLTQAKTRFCAAPEYLARRGRPASPEALAEHDCLVFRVPVDGRILSWGFERDGQRFFAPVNIAMVADDIDVLTQLAIAGGGITRLTAFMADPYIASGKLVELFSHHDDQSFSADTSPLDYYLCVSDRHQFTPKVRAFYEYLQTRLSAPQPA